MTARGDTDTPTDLKMLAHVITHSRGHRAATEKPVLSESSAKPTGGPEVVGVRDVHLESSLDTCDPPKHPSQKKNPAGYFIIHSSSQLNLPFNSMLTP